LDSELGRQFECEFVADFGPSKSELVTIIQTTPFGSGFRQITPN